MEDGRRSKQEIKGPLGLCNAGRVVETRPETVSGRKIALRHFQKDLWSDDQASLLYIRL